MCATSFLGAAGEAGSAERGAASPPPGACPPPERHTQGPRLLPAGVQPAGVPEAAEEGVLLFPRVTCRERPALGGRGHDPAPPRPAPPRAPLTSAAVVKVQVPQEHAEGHGFIAGAALGLKLLGPVQQLRQLLTAQMSVPCGWGWGERKAQFRVPFRIRNTQPNLPTTHPAHPL